jgi:hypothetical protein
MRFSVILLTFLFASCSFGPTPECDNSSALESVRQFYEKKHNVQITSFKNVRTLTRNRKDKTCGCAADITTASFSKLKKVKYSVQIPALNNQSVVYDYVTPSGN